MPFRETLRSLAHPNLRLFFAGQGLSLIGTQIQIVALPWFVYRVTGSAQWLGWVAFAGQFPAVFTTPIAGVIADRVNKRRLLLCTQSLAMVQAAILAVLALAGNEHIWPIILLNAGMSVVNGFDLPTRQSLLHELVGNTTDLTNAIALNSALFNTTRLIGPAIAGFLILFAGEGLCFAINAASFLAVLAALLAMRFPPPQPRTSQLSAFRGMVEGVRYAAGSMPIRRVLVLVALVSVLAVPYHVLMPVLVREAFDGNASLNGWLVSAGGLGALVGGLFLASRPGITGVVKRVWILPVITGLALVAISYNTSRATALALLFAIGLSVVMLLTTCNMTIQSVVADRYRGRVLSFYALAFLGMVPLGGLLAGTLAENLGVRLALRIHGFILLGAGALFAATLARRFHKRVTEAIAARLHPGGAEVV